MRRVFFSSLCAIALLASACSPTVDRAPIPPLPEIPQIPAEPVPVVIWSSRDLPARLYQQVAKIEGVRWVSRVSVGVLNLVAVSHATKPLPPRAPGAILPLSVAAMDPSPDVRDDLSRSLAAGKAVLTKTAAALRGMTVGGKITIADTNTKRSFRIGAIVPDTEGRGRELVIPRKSSGGLGLTPPRALISSVHAEHVSNALRSMENLTDGVRARVDLLGEEEDADLPQSTLDFAEVKKVFGEFTYRRTSGLFFEPDPRWKAANIIETTVPVLGFMACNRRIIPQLTGAMRELRTRRLEGLVRTFNGCYSPRMQVGNTFAVSRHAYGIAVDFNAGTNRFGEPASQDPRLVELMERWGFTWGGMWLVPDGMHFEWVRSSNGT